jgi:hypothetical protein
LEQLEPGSTHNKVVRIGRQTEPVEPAADLHVLGVHRTIPISVLTKLYHKLGSFLHVPMPRPDGTVPARLASREELSDIVETVRPAVESRFDGSLAELFHFQCERCEHEVVANAEGAACLGRMECLNPSCAAVYIVGAKDGRADTYLLDATDFDCLACSSPILVENRLLEAGHRFRCNTCAEEHELVQKHWSYGRSKELAAARVGAGS